MQKKIINEILHFFIRGIFGSLAVLCRGLLWISMYEHNPESIIWLTVILNTFAAFLSSFGFYFAINNKIKLKRYGQSIRSGLIGGFGVLDWIFFDIYNINLGGFSIWLYLTVMISATMIFYELGLQTGKILSYKLPKKENLRPYYDDPREIPYPGD